MSVPTSTPASPASDHLATRWAGFGTSIFTEMTERARAHGAVNLAQGFPDFHGPGELLDAIARHVATSHHQYAPGIGEERLRRAVAGFVAARGGGARDPAREVTITTGATEALYATINAFVGPGDKVVLFEPCYDSYVQSVVSAGGVPVPVRLSPPGPGGDAWTVDWDELDRAAAAGFRLLVLNTPHNPTGKVFTDDELARVADAVVRADAIAVSDEVYEAMTYGDVVHRSLATVPAMDDRVVRVSSAAKTFGFTGLKVGWATACPALTRAVRLVHQATVFSTTPFLQTALAEILERTDWLAAYLDELRAAYQARRDRLRAALTAAGYDVPLVRGTYFLMAGFDALAPAQTDIAFARALVERGVAAIPPSAFYLRPPARLPWLRFAFCKRDETLDRAAAVLARTADGVTA